MAGDSGGQPPPRGEVLQGADSQAGGHAAPHILQGIETRAPNETSAQFSFHNHREGPF